MQIEFKKFLDAESQLSKIPLWPSLTFLTVFLGFIGFYTYCGLNVGSSSKGVDGMIEIVEPDKSFGKEVVVFEFSGKTEGFSNKPGDTTS